MGYPVTYYCPTCGTLVELRREGYLADKAVTPYPLEGWTYVAPSEPFEEGTRDEEGRESEKREESGGSSPDGVRFVCGESEADGLRWTGDRAPDGDPSLVPEGADGCGEPFYLSFVRYEDGREVDPRGPAESVELAANDRPDGPRGPSGPGLGF